MRSSAWLLMCTSIGCGPVVLPGDGDGSATSGSEDGPSPTSSATSSTVTATSDLSTTTTTLDDDGTADDGTEAEDDGFSFDCGVAPAGTMHHCIGQPTCEPPMPDVRAGITVDDGALPADVGPDPYVYTCTIADVLGSGDTYTLTLACADGPHTLEVASGALMVGTGDDVVLSVIHGNATFKGGDLFVTLHRADGDLMIAGASTPWPPGDDGLPPDFFDPLVVTVVEGVCPIEPSSDGGEPCYGVERQALRFATARDVVEVYDHGTGSIGPHLLRVQHAEQRHDVTCSDVDGTWYSWLAFVPPPT
jgi:hypothetical protein